ncbi:MAG TPA: PfkB family carbohydrate kinase [Pyrinomonadaceae bacterium]|nr:PfkB family carbohydrate kinase [Pyrinomonadaceae bacterium]
MNFPFSLPKNKPFEAVGFGLNAVDHLIVVPQYPDFDTKVRLLEHKQTAGGQAASTMVALQRLGFKTAYAGRFGSDTEGQFGLTALQAEGVDLEFTEVVDGAHNQLAFVFIDAHNGERTIIWDRDERLSYAADEAPAALAKRGRVLHLDGHDPLAGARMAQSARSEETIVSADIENTCDGLAELLPLIDVLVVSREFPERFTGILDEKASLVELRARYGCAVVGMTLGNRGAMLYCEGQFIEAPAYEVPGGCVDTTGAGDAFHGGLLYGVLTGQDVERSLQLANAVAALKCRELGARTSLPREQEVTEFLRNANC